MENEPPKTPWQPTVAVLLLALLLIVSLYQTLNMPAPARRYEYKIEIIPDDKFQQSMNLLGYQGWEAVSARRASDGNSTAPTFSYEIIFRRPLKGAMAP